jgi:hypothetical protein
MNEFCATNEIATSSDEKQIEKIRCNVCDLEYSSYELVSPNTYFEDLDLNKWLKKVSLKNIYIYYQ